MVKRGMMSVRCHLGEHLDFFNENSFNDIDFSPTRDSVAANATLCLPMRRKELEQTYRDANI